LVAPLPPLGAPGSTHNIERQESPGAQLPSSQAHPSEPFAQASDFDSLLPQANALAPSEKTNNHRPHEDREMPICAVCS